MNKRKLILGSAFALLIMGSIGLYAQDSISFSGYVRNYTGVLLDNSDYSSDFSAVQNTFDIKADYSSDIADLHAEGYAYANADDSLTAGVRELYFDLNFNNMGLRVGKQQIIWGKADGVFITDIISPKDMTNFILPDFDEVRLGVTSVKADYYFGDFTVEGIWIPVFTPDILPSSGSLWAVSMDLPATINPSIFKFTTELPDSTLENSEGFVKVSYMAAAFDFELMGGTMFDDDPAGHVTTFNPPTTVKITKEYQRMLMGGGSFSTELAGFVLRGEGAYYNGKVFNLDPDYLQADLIAGGDGTIEKNYIHYMAGVDYVIAGVNLSTQFVQEYILDYDDRISKDEFNNTMTFLVSKQLMNDTLELKFFGYYGLNNSDALLRFSVGYDIVDGMEAVFGSDIFLGDEGYFGQYNDNDMVYVKVKYSF